MCLLWLGQNPLLVHSPLLSHLLWWRIVADEAHELLKYERDRKHDLVASEGLQTLQGLRSKYRWYVTGTPFPHAEDSLKAALKVPVLTSILRVLVLETLLIRVDACIDVLVASHSCVHMLIQLSLHIVTFGSLDTVC